MGRAHGACARNPHAPCGFRRRAGICGVAAPRPKVDATSNPIEVGDLLTMSPRLGHAMKATDVSRSAGTVIGKAMAPLASGTGLILVLVALG
jgi:hypothetical protein